MYTAVKQDQETNYFRALSQVWDVVELYVSVLYRLSHHARRINPDFYINPQLTLVTSALGASKNISVPLRLQRMPRASLLAFMFF